MSWAGRGEGGEAEAPLVEAGGEGNRKSGGEKKIFLERSLWPIGKDAGHPSNILDIDIA